MPRQQAFEEADFPLLKRLRQDGVAALSFSQPQNRRSGLLCVRKHLSGDFPGSSVWNFLLVDQDTHELRDGQSRVRIVHWRKLNTRQRARKLTLDANVVGQFGPWFVKLGESAENVLAGQLWSDDSGTRANLERSARPNFD